MSLGAVQMALHRAFGNLHDGGDALDGLLLEVEQCDRGALGIAQARQGLLHRERGLHIVVGIAACRLMGVVVERGVLSLAAIGVELVVGDAVKPCREARYALERPQVDVSLEKRLLRQVVAQHGVAQGEVHQHAPHLWLVSLDELPKCAPVVGQHASGNQCQFVESFHRCVVAFTGYSAPAVAWSFSSVGA